MGESTPAESKAEQYVSRHYQPPTKENWIAGYWHNTYRENYDGGWAAFMAGQGRMTCPWVKSYGSIFDHFYTNWMKGYEDAEKEGRLVPPEEQEKPPEPVGEVSEGAFCYGPPKYTAGDRRAEQGKLAYEQGWVAHWSGLAERNNPYKHCSGADGVEYSVQWHRGWGDRDRRERHNAEKVKEQPKEPLTAETAVSPATVMVTAKFLQEQQDEISRLEKLAEEKDAAVAWQKKCKSLEDSLRELIAVFGRNRCPHYVYEIRTTCFQCKEVQKHTLERAKVFLEKNGSVPAQTDPATRR